MNPETAARMKDEQGAISLIDRTIADLMAERRKHEQRVFELRDKRVANGWVVLAAKHLTLGEGPVFAGYTMTETDVSALRTVIDFVSRHKDCEAE